MRGDKPALGLSTLAATSLAGAVLLVLLGHKPLTNWDEAIYAEVSREMLRRGWVVPHWNGQLWCEKPPLMLWVTAVFFKLFGVTEFWARAGSALSGVALVGLLHGWLARREGMLAAWLGTVILLSTFGFLHVGRVGEMDVLLSLGCVVSLCGLTLVEEGKPAGWYGFWSGFAVAAMTKGAASGVLLLTLVAAALMGRWGSERFGRACWLGMAGFLALVLPWHVFMWARFGAVFLREYIGFHVLARASQAIEGHRTHAWFYLWVLLVSAMPWVLLAPVAMLRAFRRRQLRVWAVFVLVVLAAFTAVQTRLPHYVAPVYPALAVLTAAYLADRLRVLAGRWGWRRAGVVAVVVGLSAFGAGAAVTARGRAALHSAKDVHGELGSRQAVDAKELVQMGRVVATSGRTGPLLLWWEDRTQSVATALFYAGGTMLQVQVSPLGAGVVRDRYTYDPVTLAEAVREGPRAILLETRLVGEIPAGFVYERAAAGKSMEVGWLRRR